MEKIKTLAEYQQLAHRTCPDLGQAKNVNHMWLGVITEVGEILDIFKKKIAYNKPMDMVNMGEEIADCSWYEVNDTTLNSLIYEVNDVDEIVTDWESTINFAKLVVEGNDVATEENKINFAIGVYADFLQDYVSLTHNERIGFHIAMAGLWEIDYYQVLTNNIAKLQVRYPDKFSEESALNRDLDAEREVLEVEAPKVDENNSQSIE